MKKVIKEQSRIVYELGSAEQFSGILYIHDSKQKEKPEKHPIVKMDIRKIDELDLSLPIKLNEVLNRLGSDVDLLSTHIEYRTQTDELKYRWIFIHEDDIVPTVILEIISRK